MKKSLKALQNNKIILFQVCKKTSKKDRRIFWPRHFENYVSEENGLNEMESDNG